MAHLKEEYTIESLALNKIALNLSMFGIILTIVILKERNYHVPCNLIYSALLTPLLLNV
jgi:hypothetical protein